MRVDARVLAVAGSLFLGAGVACLGQAVSPFHLPTHEFAQGLCALGLFWITGSTAAVFRRGHDAPGRGRQALTIGLAGTLAVGIGAQAVQLTANAVAYACNAQDASMFFWVTWLPVGALAAVLGVAIAERGWGTRKGVAVLVALCAASGANDGLQFLAGVRMVDPLLGDPLAFNQRTPMAVPLLHAWHRIWLASCAVALWAVTRWWRNGHHVRTAVAVFPVLLLTFGAGSHIGVGCSRHALHATLDATFESDHLVFRYDSRGRASRYIPAIARDGEWHIEQLRRAWGIEPQRKVLVRVYDNNQDLGRLTGRAWPHGGFYGLDIPLWRTQTSTYPHELVHALHAELSWNPRLIWNRGMTEGTAVAFTEGLADEASAHTAMAAALHAGRLPQAQQLLAVDGFHTVNEGNAYDAAGSFLGFLVLRHGMDRYAELQRTFDWEGVYGTDLPGLDLQWRTFLREEVPVDLATKARARDAFDPQLKPAYVDKRCPKLGSSRQADKDAAERLYVHGDYEAANELFTSLLERQGKTRWALRSAASLDRLDRHPDVVAMIDAQLGRDDLGDDERFKLLERQLRSHILLRDWPRMEDTFDALRRLEPEPPTDRAQLETCLRDEALRGAVADLLERGASWGARAPMLALAQEYPDNEALAVLIATRVGSIPGGERDLVFTARDRARLHEVLAFIEGAPAACDPLSPPLIALADKAIRLGELDLADRLAATIVAACTTEMRRYEATQRLERVAWERGKGR